MWKLRKKPKKDEFDMRGPKPRSCFWRKVSFKFLRIQKPGVIKSWRLFGTDKEPDHFGDDELPRPPGLQRIAKSQRSGSNSTASSGSNPVAYQEFMAEQYDLDRKVKMQVLSQESKDRRRLIQAQKIAEDMKVLQIDTSGMDPTYAAIINAQKERIRAEYLPPNCWDFKSN
ncbi:hypothetical protein Tco_1139569 [Tanacetum coccineum]